MSLHEVYFLAHSAECRLQISANRPDRNLRVVVGHLLHYESLRLRIVEIEHGVGMAERARAGRSERSQLSHATSQLPRTPRVTNDVEDVENTIDSEELDHDDDGDELSLTRFSSGSSKPPPLVIDEDEGDQDEREPKPPDDPDPSSLEQALNGPDDSDLAKTIERVRKCPCHAHTESPQIEHVWTLPPSQKDKLGIVRAVAQVA